VGAHAAAALRHGELAPRRSAGDIGPLLAITPGDDGTSRDLTAWFGPLADAGLSSVVLREPEVTAERLARLCEVAGASGLEVWVHDRNPAARSRTEGLHLTAKGAAPRGRRFGRSCHTPAELDDTFAEGATYALLSPVFPPTSKGHDARTPLGIERAAAWAAGRSVWGLGGITPPRVGAVRDAGLRGVAVLGAIFGQRSPADGAKMVTTLLAAWSDGA
ncbi:MAG: thiamine phosphate synthase, partial [Myxococcota bacterium]